jgi:hypothetical protein
MSEYTIFREGEWLHQDSSSIRFIDHTAPFTRQVSKTEDMVEGLLTAMDRLDLVCVEFKWL